MSLRIMYIILESVTCFCLATMPKVQNCIAVYRALLVLSFVLLVMRKNMAFVVLTVSRSLTSA